LSGWGLRPSSILLVGLVSFALIVICSPGARASATVIVRTQLKTDWPATLIASAVFAAWTFVLVDVSGRNFDYVPLLRHLAGALALYAMAGTVAGLIAWGVIAAERQLFTRIDARNRRLARRVRPGVYALLAAIACANTAFWTFSGARVSSTGLARVGPYVFIAGVASASWLVAWLTMRAFGALNEGRRRLAIALAVGCAVTGAALMVIDLRVYVALYTRLHSLLEASAALLAFTAFSLLLYGLSLRFHGFIRAVRVIAFAAVAFTLLAVAWSRVRDFIDRSLRHVWVEENYVGRGLRRFSTLEAFLANPGGFRGLEMSRVQRLRERFDVSSTAKDPAWDQPLQERSDVAQKLKELRDTRTDFNIVIFYVDTLRQDAASDPQLMPAVVRFSRRSLNFRRAYSTGSDTLRALPGLTGGGYFFGKDNPNDLLAVATRTEILSVLFIAQSAHEFLSKLRPSFRFEQTVTIPDYPPEKTDVWGYGADGPTTGRIVDQALDWLKKHKKQRSLLWLFNFDQHNWRELDSEYVNATARRFGIPDNGEPSWRYRVIARAVDAEFGRFLRGLAMLGLADRTIVLFVSDHGEALGRDGFWVHSVFLWESLVRVPLILRVPGLKPRAIDDRVSLVDVAPTLARYMQQDPPTDGYHGEDLLSYLVPRRPPRRLPLLMAGVNKEQLVRVGLVDPEAPYKLVVSLEASAPELYDLKAPDPDLVNVADREPDRALRMLSALVRSPVFPRSVSDLSSPTVFPRSGKR